MEDSDSQKDVGSPLDVMLLGLQSTAQINKENSEFLTGLRVDAETSFTSPTSGKHQMLAKILLELMTIDRERPSEVVKTWQQHNMTTIGISSNRGFSSFEDDVPWRSLNVAGPYDPSILLRSYPLTLESEELQHLYVGQSHDLC